MKLDPEQLLQMLGLDYSPKTNRLSMLCPWHDDTDPSSGFYLDTEKFFCFSCEISYSMVEFYGRFKEIPFNEAQRQLEKEFGEIPPPRKVDRISIARALSIGNEHLKGTRGVLERDVHAFLGS